MQSDIVSSSSASSLESSSMMVPRSSAARSSPSTQSSRCDRAAPWRGAGGPLPPAAAKLSSAPETVEAQPELHFVADVGDAELHPEIRALERARGVASALIALPLRAGIRTALP